MGFAQTQWRLFEKETPHRVKPLLYVYRVLLTGIHLMQTGEIEANLGKLNEKFNLAYIPDLITRKLEGKEKSVLEDVDISFYQREYEGLLVRLQEAFENSTLSESPSSKEDLNALVVRIRIANFTTD